MIDLYEIITNNTFLDIIFSILKSTSGEGGGVQTEIVRYLIGTGSFIVLFSISILHRTGGFFDEKRDNLIIWGFGMGFLRNIILLTISIITYILTVVHTDIINPSNGFIIHIHSFVNTPLSSLLIELYPPLSHFLHMISMLLISMALLRYVMDETSKERKYRQKYISLCISISLLIFIISIFFINKFYIMDYVWHGSSFILLLYPIFLIYKYNDTWISNIIIALFGMYMLYDLGKILELLITPNSIFIIDIIRHAILNITPLIIAWIFIKESIVRLEEQTISSKTLSDMQELFITGTSHELASPIAGMEGYLKILEKKYNYLDPNIIVHDCPKSMICKRIPITTKILQENVQHIKSILRIMKDYGHTKDYNEVKFYDINILTQKCYNAIQFADTTKKIPKENFIFYDESNIHNYKVKLSPYKYRQIIENLVNNAIRAVDIAQPEHPSVKISIKCTYLGCVVKIKDNGIGMSEDDLKHCFQKKWTTYENQGGTGLGLYFVKKYVEELEGTIHINSKKGLGTTVRIVLPTEIVK
jgi:signal transduction histidine kinase